VDQAGYRFTLGWSEGAAVFASFQTEQADRPAGNLAKRRIDGRTAAGTD
jgi:hypothetical protein